MMQTSRSHDIQRLIAATNSKDTSKYQGDTQGSYETTDT